MLQAFLARAVRQNAEAGSQLFGYPGSEKNAHGAKADQCHFFNFHRVPSPLSKRVVPILVQEGAYVNEMAENPYFFWIFSMIKTMWFSHCFVDFFRES